MSVQIDLVLVTHPASHLYLLFFGHGAQGMPRRSVRSGSGFARRSGGLYVGEPVGLVVCVARLSRAHEGVPLER